MKIVIEATIYIDEPEDADDYDDTEDTSTDELSPCVASEYAEEEDPEGEYDGVTWVDKAYQRALDTQLRRKNFKVIG